jgi:PIN domain nuclease of toxin-antitoxin system
MCGALILLDTHVWIWWISDPRQLSAAARRRIDAEIAEGQVAASAISCWEIGLLARKGRLALAISVEDWITRCEALPFLRLVPVDSAIALRSTHLPGDLHDDPADRIIVATALSLGIALITKDQRLRDYPHLQTVW